VFCYIPPKGAEVWVLAGNLLNSDSKSSHSGAWLECTGSSILTPVLPSPTALSLSWYIWFTGQKEI
jgi:hypothetical protein